MIGLARWRNIFCFFWLILVSSGAVAETPVTIEQLRHGWPAPGVERWVFDSKRPLPAYRVVASHASELRLSFSAPVRFLQPPRPSGALASVSLSSGGTVLHLKLQRGQWGKRFVLLPNATHPFHRLVMDIRHDAASASIKRPLARDPELRPKTTPLASGRRPVIVVDPGHGGKDPGTMANGLVEKSLALRYSLGLAGMLSPRYTVRMTREDDRFLSLAERVRLAREAKADLFVSLHVDSHPDPHIRGLSVHSLAAKASDEATAMLVASENTALEDDWGIASDDPRVRDILVDLLRRETDNLSANFAHGLIASWQSKHLLLLPKPYRQGNFRILKAVDIPGVIIELGFASHPMDAKQLIDPAYEKKILESIAEGIDRYSDRILPNFR